VAVEAAGVRRGERVLDVACGTGNAALAAASRGASVSGLDAAERLIGVARERARAAGIEAEWRVGDAGGLPFPDDSFDVAVSVFGVIFAPAPARAAAELERVVRPGGRIVVTAWIDRGPLAEVMHASRAAATRHLPASPATGDHLDWSDPQAVAGLFTRSTLEVEERSHPFTAASPRAWVDEQFAHHPAWRGMAAALPAPAAAELTDELVEILAAANEDRAGLRVLGPYALYRAVVRS
jgi:SAM-dependent methyltransferase